MSQVPIRLDAGKAARTALTSLRGSLRRRAAASEELLRRALAALALGTTYYVAALAALTTAARHEVVASFWPPAGLALYALLRFGPGLWPGIALGAFALNVNSGVPSLAAAAIAAGNAAGAVAGLLLLDRAGLSRSLDRTRDVLSLAAVGAFGASCVNATVGALSLVWSGSAAPAAFATLWLTWWSGDAAGILVVTPLLLAWSDDRRGLPAGRRLESVVTLALLAGLTRALFLGGRGYVYGLFPAVGAFAFRSGPRGVSAAVATVAAVAMGHTVAGRGAFGAPSPAEGLVLLQIFLCLLSVSGLLLAAALAEREEAHERLGQQARQLDAAQQLAGLGSWRWDLRTGKVEWSPGLYRIYGLAGEAFEGTLEAFVARVHPEDREAVSGAVRAALAARGSFRLRERILRPDGEVRMLATTGECVPDASGTVTAMLGVCQDVSEQWLAERERAQLLARAEAARAEAERALARYRSVQAITDAALSRLDLDELLRELLERVRQALKLDFASLLLSAGDGTLHRRASVGLAAGEVVPRSIPFGTGAAGRVAAAARPLVLEDVSTIDTLHPLFGGRLRSFVGVPLLLDGRVVGVVTGATEERRRFDDDDVSLIEIVAARVAPVVERARLLEEVRESRRRLEFLSLRLVEVQEAERRDVGRELHDEIGQLVTGLKLLLAAGPPGGGAALEVRRISDELTERVRNLSMDLRPPMLDELGLLPTLLWHLERYQARTGVSVGFSHGGIESRFPAQVETAVFRIVQETLTNVARHAGTKQAELAVHATPFRLHLRVEDRGRGFAVEAAARAGACGLAGMEERARLLGGRLRVESAPGSGTRVLLELPLAGDPP